MEIIQFIFTCIVCVQMVFLSKAIILNLKSPVKNAGKDSDTPSSSAGKGQDTPQAPEGLSFGHYRNMLPSYLDGKLKYSAEICTVKTPYTVYISAEYVKSVEAYYLLRELVVHTVDGKSTLFESVYDYRFVLKEAVNPRAMARSLFRDGSDFRTAPLI